MKPAPVCARSGVKCYLGLGANLNARATSLARAVWLLSSDPHCRVVRLSSVYETAPVGNTDQPAFLNLVAELRCMLSPLRLLDLALRTESRMGRVRVEKWGPRVIDIDLLTYDDMVMETDRLTLPHPLMAQRQFVLAPLAEIAPPSSGRRRQCLLDGRPVESVADPDDPGVRRAGRLAQLVRREMGL